MPSAAPLKILETYRELTAPLVAACVVISKYDQPWLANRSRDGQRVYVYRHVPVILPKTGINTSKSLPWHELGEWLAMNNGRDYDWSHSEIANPLEREEVERQRPDDPDIWHKYTDEMDGYIRAVDDETIRFVAPDQDLREFEDDDVKLLRKILATQKREKTNDAVNSVDPTGTSSIQRALQSTMDKRWLRLKQLVAEALTTADILGLQPTPQSILTASHNPVLHKLPGRDKVEAFRRWIDEAMRQIVIDDGLYHGYVREASNLAAARVGNIFQVQKPTRSHGVDPAEVHISNVVTSELRGICGAVSQQATRILGNGMVCRAQPSKIAREIGYRIDAVGKHRTRLLNSYAVTKAFNSATLDLFRSLGVSHVNTIAERVRGKMISRPGKSFRVGDRSPKQEMVEVATAGDDHVCPICEEISEDGPYTIDEANDLIPAHALCRCAFVPVAVAVQDFDPDELRDPHGRWTEGGATASEFISPNVETLDFDQAMSATTGSNQRRIERASNDIDSALFLNTINQ